MVAGRVPQAHVIRWRLRNERFDRANYLGSRLSGFAADSLVLTHPSTWHAKTHERSEPAVSAQALRSVLTPAPGIEAIEEKLTRARPIANVLLKKFLECEWRYTIVSPTVDSLGFKISLRIGEPAKCQSS